MTTDQKHLIESLVKDLAFNTIIDFNISVESAFSLVYNSETVEKLYDLRTGLYQQSTLYIYNMFLQEINQGKIEKEY